MKNLMLVVVVLSCLLAACNGDGAGAGSGNSSLTSSKDSVSYAIGNYLTSSLSKQGVKVNSKELNQGFEDMVNDTGLSFEDAQEFITQFQMEMMMRQGKPVTDDNPLKLDNDSLSYAIGMDFSKQMQDVDYELNPDAFGAGSMDFGTPSAKLDSAAVAAQITAFSMTMQKLTTEKMAKQGAVNIEEGKAFLAENATKEGVKSTDSGLQYKVLTPGKGKKPAATDKVEVHYHGTLLDGTVFDSSVDRGTPAEFGLNQVIPGWTEGVQLMREGAKFRFYVPSDLAYRDRGSPPKIGPNATLIFDVELLSIKGDK